MVEVSEMYRNRPEIRHSSYRQPRVPPTDSPESIASENCVTPWDETTKPAIAELTTKNLLDEKIEIQYTIWKLKRRILLTKHGVLLQLAFPAGQNHLLPPLPGPPGTGPGSDALDRRLE